MRRLILAVLMVLSVVPMYVEAVVPQKVKQELTPEEKQRRREAAKQRRYVRTGGLVQAPYKGRVVSVVNMGKDVDAKILAEFAQTVEAGLRFPVEVGLSRSANAGIVLEVRDSDYPAAFIVAPENGYAMVNVAKLRADGASGDKLNDRLFKELWRSLVYLLGGGNNPQPNCIMKPITSPRELDAFTSRCPCPLSFTFVTDAAKRFGVSPRIIATYLEACQEGWADKPTNDVQRAIWDKVHQVPSAPIQIKFDPKSDK